MKNSMDMEQILNHQETPFDVSEWMAHETEVPPEDSHDFYNNRKIKKFKENCRLVKKELDRIINVDTEGNQNNEWIDRQHNAIIGDPTAIDFFLAEINTVLRNRMITDNDFPEYYGSLAEAIFHEVWGQSILVKWEMYPDSEACAIRGVELWIDINGTFVKQEEEFESLEVVNRIKRAFVIRRADSIINRENPELEIEKEDGSRITIIQPPRSREYYFVLRRFIVKSYTLEDQAKRNTIPFEDVPIYRALSRTMPNAIVAGRVRSAKSTFLQTLVGERNSKYVGAVLEKHFELALGKHFPNRLFFEIQAKEGDLHKAIPRLLRMEHDYIVVGEIRSLEIEAYLQSTERGERGALSTYHLTDVENVVEQLARHTLDEFPSRRFDVEVERVAKNLDIVITMESDRDRTTKRVIGVTEVIWDYTSRTHSTQDLVRYSHLTKKYYYSSNISTRLLKLMAQEDLKETKLLLHLLKEREKVSPISELKENKDLAFVLE